MLCLDIPNHHHDMMATATPITWQEEPALNEASSSSSLPVSVNKRQRTEPQQQQQKQQQKRSPPGAASQSRRLRLRLPGAPTTGYDVLLVGERAYTQGLAKALLQVSEHDASALSQSSASASSSSSAYYVAADAWNVVRRNNISSGVGVGVDVNVDVDVDRLAVDALQRTLSNATEKTSVSALWKRRHVHMVQSLASTTMTSTTPSASAATAAATATPSATSATATSQRAAGDANASAVSVDVDVSVSVDVDNMNHIVIVVPTAVSPHVWETVPLHGVVQRELDAITSMSSLRESLLMRQRVSIVAIIMTAAAAAGGGGGANSDSVTTTNINNINNKDDRTNTNKAHSYVPMFLCHTTTSSTSTSSQDANSFHCTARQLWKRIAIGARTDPVSTVSPLLLARKHRE